MSLSRRRFIQSAGAALAAGAGVVGYTVLIEPEWVSVEHRWLPIRQLPDGLAGSTLVQLSDLHVGPRVDSDYLIRTFRRVTSMQPDVVVFTGDFITYRGAAQMTELARVLEAFPRGRRATLVILGKHDYGIGWRQPEVADRVVEIATEAGITVLRNTPTVVEGLTITGMDDLWANRFAPEAAWAGRPGQMPGVVLCHNPDALDREGWAGYRGWVLAGHTHGGQCKPPFLPPPLLPVENRRYTAGVVPLADGRSLYINRGLGHLLRVRFNARPEVTVFTLRNADLDAPNPPRQPPAPGS